MFSQRPASFDAPVLDATVTRTVRALSIAALIGAIAFVAPPLALLALAGLAAWVLIKGDGPGFDAVSLAAPFAAAFIVGALIDFAAGVGLLLIWRLWVDTNWSVAEARRLAHAAGRPIEATRTALFHAWTTPAYGLALVAYTAPHMVAGLPLDLPHIPLWVVLATGALALLAVGDWALRRAVDWRLGELAPAPAAHLLAHHAVMLTAFGLGLDVSAGIAAALAWRLANSAPLGQSQASLTAVP